MNGSAIRCAKCGGKGLLRNDYDPGVPDECEDCAGSGKNWRYAGGALARYYGGPLIGKGAANA